MTCCLPDPGSGSPKLEARETGSFGELVRNYLKRQEGFCKP